MKICKESLKNGVEIDMPKLPGDKFTKYAIRYVRPDFQYYNFKTEKVIYASRDLKYIVEESNRIHNLNDTIK